jgi:hypothetical protein
LQPVIKPAQAIDAEHPRSQHQLPTSHGTPTLRDSIPHSKKIARHFATGKEAI